VSELAEYLQTDEIRVISYADDSYVIVRPKNLNNLSSLVENTLAKHIDFLRDLGMIVNESKTEIMWIGKNRSFDYVKVGQNLIPFSETMKALGVYFQGDLSWDAQADNVITKSKNLLSCFKFLRKYLTETQFLQAASANYYGSVFYCTSVWYHNLKKHQKVKLNSFHFRLLRTAKKDYNLKLKRTELTELCKRATPEQWTKFITATRVIKILRDGEPKELLNRLKSVYFEEKRQPGTGLFFDASRTKKGQQSFQNRLLFMRSIKYPWNQSFISDDVIRIEMKKAFFTF